MTSVLLLAFVVGSTELMAQVSNLTASTAHTTIQDAVDNATTGDLIQVSDGIYNENVVIDKSLTLRSENGRATTSIVGSDNGTLGTVYIDPGVSDVTIGEAGQGFTIVGFDNNNGAIEAAAVYFPNNHSNITIRDNEIQANGEHGLLSNFNSTIDNIIIDMNEFSGQTFTGANPDGIGFGTQFAPMNNVPRQLVTLGGGSTVTASMNITFTNNDITGTTGGISTDDGVSEQGNNLVTIDVIGANISGNSFAGTTTRFAGSLRARGTATDVFSNDFSSAGLSATTYHYFGGNGSFTGATNSPTLDAVGLNNTYDKGSYISDATNANYIDLNPQTSYFRLSVGNDGQVIKIFPGSYPTSGLDATNAPTYAPASPGQVRIDKNVDFIGLGSDKTQTVITPTADTGTSGDARGWFLVDPGVTLNVENLTFNGSGNLIYQAFRHRGGGLFDNVLFTEIKYNESGPHYRGTAIAAFGNDVVDVLNSMFTEIGRIGVLYFGTGVSGSFFDSNMYTGKGDGDFLDYALDIGAGADLNVNANTISDNRGVASVDNSKSAGILVSTFFAGGTMADITNNTITDNTCGVTVGFNASDASVVTINNNDIVGNISFGVNTSSLTNSVDATLNWWGDANGPSGQGPGSGDVVSENVLFCPWLDGPFATGSPAPTPAAVIINCPTDITVSNDPGLCSAMVDFEVTADAPCATTTPGITVNQTAGLASGSAFPLGTTTVTFEATDGTTKVSCSFNVTVNFVPQPFDCPEDIEVAVGTGECTAVVEYELPPSTATSCFQGFEDPTYTPDMADNSGWFNFGADHDRSPSGTDGIVSSTGAAHATIDNSSGSNAGPFTRLCGYSNEFGGGFTTSLDVYMDVNDPAVLADTYGWDLTSAANRQDGTHLRDFIFHTASNAAGEILVGGSNNTNFTRRNDLATLNHYAITSTGWYTYEWVFRDQGGALAVDLNLKDAAGTVLWTETRFSATDDIATIVGGNRYMWFPFVEVESLSFDNTTSTRTSTAVVSCDPASGTAFPIGTTTVSCTSDECGTVTTCTFDVTVTDEPSLLACPATVQLSFNLNCSTDVVLPDFRGQAQFEVNCLLDTIIQDPLPGTDLSTLVPPGAPFPPSSTFPVTVTGISESGDSTECTFIVELIDGVGPTIACPGDQEIFTSTNGDGSCQVSLPDLTSLATAGVLCGNELTNVTQSPVATDSLGGVSYMAGTTITVTLTADDGTTTTSCSFEVTFTDDSAPELVGVCTDPAPVTLVPDACDTLLALTPPTVVDNCGGAVTITGIRSDGGPDLVGPDFEGRFAPCSSTVIWFASDALDNDSEALCTVTVTVTEPLNEQNEPSANCNDLTLGLDNTGTATLCAAAVDDGSTDDCGGELTYEIAVAPSDDHTGAGLTFTDCVEFDCDDIGTVQFVCLRVTDCSGNINICTSEVTVEDKRSPIIACPADITIECDVDNEGDPLAAPGADGQEDFSIAATVPVDMAALNDWLAMDPTPGQDAANGITGLPLAFDNCGATVTYFNEYFYYDGALRVGPVSYTSTLPINDPHECAHHNYEIERSWIVTDAGGRADTCVQLIVVMDTTDPVIDPNGVVDATVACDADLSSLLDSVPTATDNCYLASFELIQDNSDAPLLTPGNVDDEGNCIRETITREWLATDACGRTENLIQTIELIDTVAPTLTVTVGGETFEGEGPHQVTLETDSLLCNSLVSFATTSSDNCSDILLDGYTFLEDGQPVLPQALINLTLTNGTLTFDRVLEKGLTTFYVGVLDDCANLTFVEVEVTIIDTEAPAFADCTEDTFTFFTSNDDTPGAEVEINCAGRVTIEVPPFQDNCPLEMDGMSGSIELMIQQDPNGIQLVSGQGLFPFTQGFVDVTADAGGVINNNLFVGTHTILLVMTDASGNVSDTCSYTYVVLDDQDPMLDCPSDRDVTVSDDDSEDCTASFVDGLYGGDFGLLTNILPVVSDNCGPTATYTLSGATTGDGSFTYVPGANPPLTATAPGLTFDLNVGNTSILLEVSDAAGNLAQCTFSVTVFDDLAPTFTLCPDDITDTADEGVCVSVQDVSPTVEDNCALDRLEYTTTGASSGSGIILASDLPDTLGNFAFAVGVTEVTYLIYDEQGLFDVCQFTVTITDEEDPEIEDLDGFVVGTSGTIYVNGDTGASLPIGSLPNVDGDCQTTVDGLQVDVTDNCCVSSVQYQVVDALTGDTIIDWMAVANSPLPADSTQTLILSDVVFPKGEFTVNLRAWDCYMNEGLNDFTVVVFDDEQPAFTDCPLPQVLQTVTTDCNQLAQWTEPQDGGVVDNCLVECGVDPIVGPLVSFDADMDIDDIDTGVNVTFNNADSTATALFPVGTRYVKYYVDDEQGNRAWCIFAITVEDDIDPTAGSIASTFELTINVECDENTPVVPDLTSLPQFADNCMPLSIVQTPAAGSLLSTLIDPPFADGQTGTVTIVATDLGGNTVTATVVVTLNDDIGPYLECPAAQTILSSEEGDGMCNIDLPDLTDLAIAGVVCGSDLATVTQSPVASDSTGGVSYTAGDTITVTLTATDDAGNTATCDFQVIFADDTAPTLVDGAVCVSPAPAETAIGQCTAEVALQAPTVSDNCDGAPTVIGKRSDEGTDLTLANAFSGQFSPCETEVSWFAMDASGNLSDTLCTVTVVVTEPLDGSQPNAQCTDIDNLGLDDGGQAIVCAADIAGNSGDACTDDVTYEIALSDEDGFPLPGEVFSDCIDFNCSLLGLNYVCLKVTDCSGNESFCTAEVTVEDKRFPYLACPADIEIECDVDNMGDPLVAPGADGEDTFIMDAISPVNFADLADFAAMDPTPGQDAENGITGLPLAYDNCGATVTYSNEYFLITQTLLGPDTLGPFDYISDFPINDPAECAHHDYLIERTWTVTDAFGRSESCVQNIRVRDTEAPVIDPLGDDPATIVQDVVLECSDQAAIDSVLAILPTASDNCYLKFFNLAFDDSDAPEILSPTETTVTGDCIGFRITRSWDAFDACGNETNLTQIIDLIDTTAPELSVMVGDSTFTGAGPFEITLENDPSKCDRDVLFTATASDLCDDLLEDQYEISFFNSIFTFDYDLNGTATFSRVLPKGVHTVTVSVSDDCGNTTEVAMQVTIIDTEAPEIICPEDVTYLTSNADILSPESPLDCSALVPIVTPAFMDNCPQDAGGLQYDLDGQGWLPAPAGSVLPTTLSVGTHTIQFALIDDAGNASDTCSQTITVLDDQDPLLICPTSKEYEVEDDNCTVSIIDGNLNGVFGFGTTVIPTIADNCGSEATFTLTGATTGSGSFDYTPGTIFPPVAPTSAGLTFELNVGNTSVNYTVMDAAGNMVQCSFSVTVFDNIDPEITCPGLQFADNDPGECSATVDVAPTISDNCAIDRIEYVVYGADGLSTDVDAFSGTVDFADFPGELTALQLPPLGVVYVEYTVFDIYGNSADCIAVVTVNDVEEATPACPGDYVVGTSGTIYTNGASGATIAIGSLDFDQDGDCQTMVEDLQVVVTDNCCVSTTQYRILTDDGNDVFQDWIALTNDPQEVDDEFTLDLSEVIFPKGGYTIEVVARDCFGDDTQSCTFEVEVFDDESPAFTDCPMDRVVNASPQECDQTVTWTEPSDADVQDNCLAECGVDPIQGPFFSLNGASDLSELDGDITVVGQSNGNAFAAFPVGERFVKYFVQDEEGNTSWCIFQVTVIDNQLPTVAQQQLTATINFDLDCDQAAPLIPNYTGLPQFSDNCSDLATIVQDPAPGLPLDNLFTPPFSDGQTATVTVTLTDLGDNSVTATITVTLNDIGVPTVNCPGPQTVTSEDAGNGDCGFTLPDFTPLANADPACGSEALTLTQDPAPGTLFSDAAGTTTTVTITGTDAAGLFSTCSFEVTFEDNSAPALALGELCADPAEVLLAPGDCEAVLTLTPPAVVDNCDDGLTITGMIEGGGVLDEENDFTGTFSPCETEVTWTATDNDGNETTLCTVTVTVTEPLDALNQPLIVCNDVDLGLTDNGEASICADVLGAGSTDDCGGDVTYLIARSDANGVPLDPTDPGSECLSYDCGDLGTNYVCLKVTDCSGNSVQCTIEIFVEDKMPPVIACPADITIACDVDNDGDPLLFDPALGLPVHADSDEAYPAANSPVVTALYDLWLNSPSASMQGQNVDNGITGVPLAFDNCGATVEYVNNYFYFDQDGNRIAAASYESTLPINDPHECAHHNYDIERVFTVTDGFGRTASCTQLIQVRDTEAPVISLNELELNAMIECDDTDALVELLAPVPTAEDDCYLASAGFTFDNSGAPEGQCQQTITRVFTAVDACGNTSTVTQTILLMDTTDPEVVVNVNSANGDSFNDVGGSFIASTDEGHCDAAITFTLELDDNCDDDLFDQYEVNLDGNAVELNGTAEFTLVLEKGINTISISVTDDCGNTTTVDLNAFIFDEEPPAFSDCNEGTLTFFTSDADTPVSESDTDDCAATVLIEVPPFQDNCPISDPLAGTGSVEMRILPDADADPIAGNFAQYIDTWVDVTNDPNNIIPGILPVGDHTVEFRMTDAIGNVSIDNCSTIYAVIDDQDPMLTCPSSFAVMLSGDAIEDGDCDFDYENGLNNEGVDDILPFVSDNCEFSLDLLLSGATVDTLTDLSFPEDLDLELNVGNTSFLYTATDDAGNMVQCSFSVTVIDDIDPMLSCPVLPDMLLATLGECAALDVDIAPDPLDNCDGGTVSYVLSGATLLSGELPVEDIEAALDSVALNVGTTTIVYTYTDADGNSSSCTTSVLVKDDQLPFVDCPGLISIGTSADGAGDCETTAAGLVFDAIDNCSIASVQYQIVDNATGDTLVDWTVIANTPLPADGDMTLDLSDISFEKGDYDVRFRAWDDSMNEGLCTTNVVVSDDEAPAFTDCPAPQTVSTSTAACGQNVQWTSPTQAGVADNCLVECGVEDIVGPLVSLDADQDMDDIDGDIAVINPTQPQPFALFPVGTRYVKYYVEDAAGNGTWCIFEVTVIDDIAPQVLACPSQVVVVNMDLDCDNTLSLADYTTLPDFTDNCENALVITQAVNAASAFTDGDVVVDGQQILLDIIATDGAGATAVCQITLEVNDDVLPGIQCPNNQVVSASTPGVVGTDCRISLADYTALAFTSVACGDGSDLVVTQSPAPTAENGATYAIGQFPMPVTLTVTDGSGNEASCSFLVFYTDDVPPSLVQCGPDPAEGLTAIGGCTAAVALTPPTVEDCGGSFTTVIGFGENGEVLNSGNGYTDDFPACTTVVTWMAIDAQGNSAEVCQNTVTVFEPDNQLNDPTAACRTDMVIELGDDGVVSLFAATYGNNSYDNCTNADLDYAIHVVVDGEPQGPGAPQVDFGCDDIGLQVICLIVTDCSGNSSTCFGNVTIQERSDPQLVCPADITIACHTDNGGVPLTGDAPAVLTPIDDLAIAGYDRTTGQNAELGITGYAQGWDNCEATVTFSDVSTQGNDPAECSFYDYTVTRTFVITDAFGNDTDFDGNDCVQVITVKDTIAPFFSEAATSLDRFINCDDPNMGGRMSLAMALAPTANDLCYVTLEELAPQTVELDECTSVTDIDGNVIDNIFEQTIRTWVATDACDNDTTFTQVISIFDTTAPNISCPGLDQPTTFSVNAGCDAPVTLFASASDCQDLTLSYEVKDLTVGSATIFSGPVLQFQGQLPPGDYCIEFTATDLCGNSASCLYFFDVIDVTAPVLDCAGLPDDDGDASNGNAVALGTDDGLCSADYTFDHPVLDDECGATLLVDYGLGDGIEEVIGATATLTLPTGSTTVSYYAEDEEGLTSATCSFTITVTDDELPTIDCFADTEITLLTSSDGFFGNNYDCDVVFNWKSPLVGDNCGVDSYTILIEDSTEVETFFDESFSVDFPVGVNQVIYTVTDQEGNVSTCTLTITVIDDDEPVTLCQDATIQLDENGQAVLEPIDVDGGSYDNCTDSLNLGRSVDQDLFDCSDLGADNTVILTISDEAGNFFQCAATVTVEDDIAPTIEDCDDREADAIDGTCAYTVQGGEFDPTALDNCSATLVNDYNGEATLDGESFSTGTTSVTWTATDASGNTSTCTHTVTISNADLAAVCTSYTNTNFLTLGDDGTLTLTAADFDGGSGSACDDLTLLISVDNGITYLPSNTFTCDDITTDGPMAVYLQVTDNATGETAPVCLAQLTLTDGPVFVQAGDCPDDISVPATPGMCGADVTLPLPIVDGSCPVISYSVDGADFITVSSAPTEFLEIGDHIVEFAISNASEDDGAVLGTTGNICSVSVTVEEGPGAMLGCTDPAATNFDPAASCDDDSCILTPAPCITVDDLPYAEDFEEGTGQWTQELIGDDIDWTLNSGSTPTEGTGPDAASSGAQYLYIESSTPNYPGKEAIINSPCLDLLETSQTNFAFAYNMNGEGVGRLDLEVTVDGDQWEPVWTKEGDQGDQWIAEDVDLSAYVDEMIKVRFHGETTNSYNGDIAIDQFGFQAAADPGDDCPGDITGDGLVDIQDFIAFNSAFGSECEDCAEDIDKDGLVDINDFLILNSAFGTDCNDAVGMALSSDEDLATLVAIHQEIDVNEDLQKILDDMTALHFTVYPNPNMGHGINLFLDRAATEVVVKVQDVAGRVLSNEVLQGSVNGLTHYIDFQEKLSSGMYMVMVETDGVTTTKRFVVE